MASAASQQQPTWTQETSQLLGHYRQLQSAIDAAKKGLEGNFDEAAQQQANMHIAAFEKQKDEITRRVRQLAQGNMAMPEMPAVAAAPTGIQLPGMGQPGPFQGGGGAAPAPNLIAQTLGI